MGIGTLYDINIHKKNLNFPPKFVKMITSRRGKWEEGGGK